MIRKNNCTTKTVQKWPKWSNWSLISDQAAKRDLWCWKEGETSMKALYASLTKQMERIQDLFKIFSPLDPTLALCESAWGSQLSPHPLTTPELHQTVSGPPLPSTRSFRSWLSPLRISGWVLSASQRRSQRIERVQRGVLDGCALHTVQADCPSDRLNGWVPPPPVQRHMLSPNLCCHPLTKSALWSIKLVKTSDGVFNVEVLHPSGWPFCTLPLHDWENGLQNASSSWQLLYFSVGKKLKNPKRNLASADD